MHGHFRSGKCGGWRAHFSGPQSGAYDERIHAVLGGLLPEPAVATHAAAVHSGTGFLPPPWGWSKLEIDYGLGVVWRPQLRPQPTPPPPQAQPRAPATAAIRQALASGAAGAVPASAAAASEASQEWSPQAFTGGGGLTARGQRRQAFTLQFNPALLDEYLKDHESVRGPLKSIVTASSSD